MKRGAANYGADFVFGIALFFIAIIFLFSFSSCIKGIKEDSAQAPISQLKSQEELIVLLKTPIEYNNQKMLFSDLIVRYYYLEQGKGNDQQKGSQHLINPAERRLCYLFLLW